MNESFSTAESGASSYASAEPKSERYRLPAPVAARFGSTEVLILELSRERAVIEHYHEFIASGPRSLAFIFSSTPLVLDARVLSWKSRSFRNGSGRVIFRSEVEFLQRVGDAFNLLMLALTRYETHLREMQEANARGIYVREWADEARVDPRDMMYVSFRLRDGRWERTLTAHRTQPEDGFTVSEHETEAQLRLLRRSYESADETGREMIRHMAALSLLPPA